jgi:hypothetical protein
LPVLRDSIPPHCPCDLVSLLIPRKGVPVPGQVFGRLSSEDVAWRPSLRRGSSLRLSVRSGGGQQVVSRPWSSEVRLFGFYPEAVDLFSLILLECWDPRAPCVGVHCPWKRCTHLGQCLSDCLWVGPVLSPCVFGVRINPSLRTGVFLLADVSRTRHVS